jgi:enoyl-CoA hydratase
MPLEQSKPDDRPIVVEDRGSARWIFFNRPQVHNAQDVAMLEDLDEALGQIEDEEGVRVLVLAGNGRSFCAGHDLKQSATNPEYRSHQSTAERRWRQERRLFVRPVERLRALPIPTICRVQGACLTAGLTFVEACDLVAATPDAVFASPTMSVVETNDAEIPTFVRNVGIRRAKQLVWLGERLTAAEALECGLVNWVIEADDIDKYIEEIAAKLADVSRETLELSKLSFRFLETRQGWDDFDAYHFVSHQLSHHTSAALDLYESRLAELTGDGQDDTAKGASRSDDQG